MPRERPPAPLVPLSPPPRRSGGNFLRGKDPSVGPSTPFALLAACPRVRSAGPIAPLFPQAFPPAGRAPLPAATPEPSSPRVEPSAAPVRCHPGCAAPNHSSPGRRKSHLRGRSNLGSHACRRKIGHADLSEQATFPQRLCVGSPPGPAPLPPLAPAPASWRRILRRRRSSPAASLVRSASGPSLRAATAGRHCRMLARKPRRLCPAAESRHVGSGGWCHLAREIPPARVPAPSPRRAAWLLPIVGPSFARHPWRASSGAPQLPAHPRPGGSSRRFAGVLGSQARG